MYQKPKTAKRLYFDVIPKAMDEYLTFVQSYSDQDDKTKLDNPAFHIHAGNLPLNQINFNVSYSLLLNLASACNPENDKVLWGFISKYQQGLSPETSPLLNKMIHAAINYYNDFIKANKKFRPANDAEKIALLDLVNLLQSASFEQKQDGALLQNLVFQAGKNHGYEKNMRDWFLALYQILLGQDQGPRMGSFIALFGIENFVKLVEEKIN
jgi:lysyl-tRNA synthetase class 1